MLRLALFFAGGGAYFVGLAFIILSPLLTNARNKILHAMRDRLLGLGLILVFLSSTPAPIWYYALLIVVLAGWLTLRSRAGARVPKWRDKGRAAVVLACVLGLALEWPHRFMPELPADQAARMYLLGDTLNAESAERHKTWPQFLASAHSIEVHDLSHAGATLESTADLLEELEPGSTVVVLLVGMNDVWGDTTAGDFERQLTTLLDRTRAPGRRLVMFELPLPLLGHRYGWTQRRLARKYGVALVPRHRLAGLLLASDSTSEDLHLSQAGHGQLATWVWEVTRPAFERR